MPTDSLENDTYISLFRQRIPFTFTFGIDTHLDSEKELPKELSGWKRIQNNRRDRHSEARKNKKRKGMAPVKKDVVEA